MGLQHLPRQLSAAAAELAQKLDQLGAVSDEPGRLSRIFLSPAMARAGLQVAEWMRQAGLEVREDSLGNRIGRLPSPRPSARTLLLGSHLDTVRDAGRFDGALGVLLPIVAAAELRRRGRTLPFHLEILGFSEEEGVRFASAYLGSKGYCGRLQEADLELRDRDGLTVRQALEALAGGAFTLPGPAHRRAELLGYLEVHIEQGPVLEAKKLPLGVVSAIAGQTRARLSWRGRAGHAGTTPMALRHDALAGASELVLAAERLALDHPPLVATVGALEARPGAPNVIPGQVVHSLDVRHPDDGARKQALAALKAQAREIARHRRLGLEWRVTQDHGATACSPGLSALLAESVRATTGRALSLPSGAGHDAVVLSRLAPIAMLFVRCRGGLSHHPDEHVDPADLEAALAATLDFLERLAAREGGR
ncbi:MAG: allantoate amidohydrolase [Thermoanaerobaculia bacterium]